MKKLTFLATLAFLFLVTSCNFFEAPTETKNGSILVDLGKNSRTVTLVNDDSVELYTISINGNGYSDKKTAFDGSSVYFDDLEPGTYTVNGYAHMGENKIVSTASTTVTVKGLETTEAVLVFKKTAFLETNFLMFYYYSDYDYSNVIYNSIDDIEMAVSTDNRKSSYHSVYEMPDSTTFTISDVNHNLPEVLYQPGNRFNNLTALTSNIDYLASDPFDCEKSGEGVNYTIYQFTIGETFEDVKTTIKVYDYLGTYINNPQYNSVSSFESIYPVTEIIRVVVRGDDFFILYSPGSEARNRLMWTQINYGPTNSFTILRDCAASDFGFTSNTEFRDIAMPNDGELYAIVGENGACQNCSMGDKTLEVPFKTRNYSKLKTPADSGITINDTRFYNRGALIKLDYKMEGSLGVITKTNSVGWYNTKRQLTAKGTYIPFKSGKAYLNEEAAEKELSSLSLYAPTKRESTNYFYGPIRFICTKPDELYIVDSGFNIRLADWNNTDSSISKTGYDTDQNGLTSNVFNHERIIKVDLASFGLSVEKEYDSYILYTDDSINSNHAKPVIELKSLFYNLNVKGLGSVATTSNYLGIHPNPEELDD